MPSRFPASPERPLQPAEDSSRPDIQLGLVALGVLGLILLLANTAFTALKEDPLFWRNAGGYSVELRQAVLFWYYPLLCINSLICMAYSGLTAAARQRLLSQSSMLAIGVAVMLWAMLFLNIGLLVANNVENVLNGRPLHYHPALTLPGGKS